MSANKPNEVSQSISDPRSDNLSESTAISLMEKIFSYLRNQTGHDFSNYKQSTIQRRVERRMVAQNLNTLEMYVACLQQSSVEVDALFQDLLIGVTNFFRDPHLFKVLEDRVIPQLFENRSTEAVIRTWTVGCSTGEEAYSLAILLVEQMEALKLNLKLQLFASDVDRNAIAIARAGLYPTSIAADVSPERLARFFTIEDNGCAYRIHKSIRDLLVFSEQDVIKDPPFSRVNLITCRNLMIYLGHQLQKKIIPLFHYALEPGGWLFLGSSEGVGEFDTLFAETEGNAKIYRHIVDLQGQQKLLISRALTPMAPPAATLARRVALAHRTEQRQPLREMMERTLLRQVTPASVLINARGDVLFVHGRIGNFTEMSAGQAGISNILKMVREGLRPGLSAMLRQAIASQKLAIVNNLKVDINGEYFLVKLSVQPVREEQNVVSDTPLYLVVFEDVPLPATDLLCEDVRLEVNDSDFAARISALSQELDAKDEYLQSTMEMLETYNENLQSTTEEMQSSNEELQSVNEELATVNAELQAKVLDLSRANNDMNNLLGGTGIGTVFVDFHFRILNFTPAVRDIFHLLDTDIGRPVTNFVSTLDNYSALEADLREVLRTLEPKQLQLQSVTGQWFVMRILPYRTLDNIVEGAVISFVDTTEMVATQNALRHNTELLERTGVLAQVGGWEVDLATMKLSWSLETFRIAELDPPIEPPLADGINLFSPEVRPIISAAVQAAIDSGTPYDLELPIIGAKGRHGWVRTQGFAEIHAGKAVRLYGTFQDITAGKKIEAAKRLADAQLERAFDASPLGMVLVAIDGRFIRVNPAFCSMLCRSKEELLEMHFQDITDSDSLPDDLRHFQDLIDGKYQTYELEKNFIHQDGHLISVLFNMSVVRDVDGAPMHFVKQVQDITERRLASNALQKALRDNEALLLTLNQHNIVSIADRSGQIIEVNDAFCAISGYSRAELIGQNHRIIHSGVQSPEFWVRMWQTISTGKAWHEQVCNLNKAGRHYWVDTIIAPFIGNDGQIEKYISIRTDITDQKQNEVALQSSLREKTALLFEVHHRVKNNLQVITSLLRLEAGRADNSATKVVLQDMQGRIRAMAALHESVYRKGSFASVDLGSYVAKIASQAVQTLAITSGAVQLRLDLGEVHVGLDQATPCGLLISELLSNSFKHGFADGRTGEIAIVLQPLDTSGNWYLRISDNGIGLSADFEARREKSLGLQLVDDLAIQMGGTLHIGPSPQAVFSVNFKAEVPAPIQINFALDE